MLEGDCGSYDRLEIRYVYVFVENLVAERFYRRKYRTLYGIFLMRINTCHTSYPHQNS